MTKTKQKITNQTKTILIILAIGTIIMLLLLHNQTQSINKKNCGNNICETTYGENSDNCRLDCKETTKTCNQIQGTICLGTCTKTTQTKDTTQCCIGNCTPYQNKIKITTNKTTIFPLQKITFTAESNQTTWHLDNQTFTGKTITYTFKEPGTYLLKAIEEKEKKQTSKFITVQRHQNKCQTKTLSQSPGTNFAFLDNTNLITYTTLSQELTNLDTNKTTLIGNYELTKANCSNKTCVFLDANNYTKIYIFKNTDKIKPFIQTSHPIKSLKTNGNKIAFIQQQKIHIIDINTKKETTINTNAHTIQLTANQIYWLSPENQVFKTDLNNPSTPTKTTLKTLGPITNNQMIAQYKLIQENKTKNDTDIFIFNLNNQTSQIISLNTLNDINPKKIENNIAWNSTITKPTGITLTNFNFLNQNKQIFFSTDFSNYNQFDLTQKYVVWTEPTGIKYCQINN